jgi:hypothetical protein
MQEIEVEMIGAESCEASIASSLDAIPCHMAGLDLGDEKYLITPISDDTAN